MTEKKLYVVVGTMGWICYRLGSVVVDMVLISRTSYVLSKDGICELLSILEMRCQIR